ncbi:hypothetical protein GGC03_18385 (plasmid) [Vibrio sp. THAF191c]|nr:hypothetical protein FIU99_22045 [Vibrio sp. THAF64]QGM36402.1 hypothetical protein GGC04_19185 [Vibrio sp. THAF191d]QGN71743.1 hypothetical protein GGC03_18385 [Vibrio sp. THAF191c]
MVRSWMIIGCSLLLGCTTTYRLEDVTQKEGVTIDKQAFSQGKIQPISGKVQSIKNDQISTNWFKDGKLTREQLYTGSEQLIEDASYDDNGSLHGFFYSKTDSTGNGSEGKYIHGVRHYAWKDWSNRRTTASKLDVEFEFGVQKSNIDIIRNKMGIDLPWKFTFNESTTFSNLYSQDIFHHTFSETLNGWAESKNKYGITRAFFNNGKFIAYWKFDRKGRAQRYMELDGNNGKKVCSFSLGKIYSCKSENSKGVIQGFQLKTDGTKRTYTIYHVNNGVLNGQFLEWSERDKKLVRDEYIDGVFSSSTTAISNSFSINYDWHGKNPGKENIKIFEDKRQIDKKFSGWAEIYNIYDLLYFRGQYLNGKQVKAWDFDYYGKLRNYNEYSEDGKKTNFYFNNGKLERYTQYDSNGKMYGTRITLIALREQEPYYLKTDVDLPLKKPEKYFWNAPLKRYTLLSEFQQN